VLAAVWARLQAPTAEALPAEAGAEEKIDATPAPPMAGSAADQPLEAHFAADQLPQGSVADQPAEARFAAADQPPEAGPVVDQRTALAQTPLWIKRECPLLPRSSRCDTT
jgi:hypothetical protein